MPILLTLYDLLHKRIELQDIVEKMQMVLCKGSFYSMMSNRQLCLNRLCEHLGLSVALSTVSSWPLADGKIPIFSQLGGKTPMNFGCIVICAADPLVETLGCVYFLATWRQDPNGCIVICAADSLVQTCGCDVAITHRKAEE